MSPTPPLRTAATRTVTGRIRRWWRLWPRWSAYALILWSSCYTAIGLHWTLGGNGFPFAVLDDDYMSGSFLEGADRSVVAPILTGIGVLGVAAGAMTANSKGRRRLPRLLPGFAWIMAVTLTFVIQDYTILVIVAFSPLLIVFAFTGIPGPQDGIGDILYWHRLHLVILFAGGLLWAATALAHQRRAGNACVHCGRRAGADSSWTSPAAARWGKWAVYAGVLSMVPYEATRIAWYFGYPIGITDEFLRMMATTPGMLSVGLGCAVAGIGGAVLTHGLIHRWGEVYPRWIWFKAGKPVPPALAIVPATVVSIALIPAGVMNLGLDFDSRLWAVTAPGYGFLLWGATLGAATYAYYLRRRGTCWACDAGD